jgi:hypothetical protein
MFGARLMSDVETTAAVIASEETIVGSFKEWCCQPSTVRCVSSLLCCTSRFHHGVDSWSLIVDRFESVGVLGWIRSVVRRFLERSHHTVLYGTRACTVRVPWYVMSSLHPWQLVTTLPAWCVRAWCASVFGYRVLQIAVLILCSILLGTWNLLLEEATILFRLAGRKYILLHCTLFIWASKNSSNHQIISEWNRIFLSSSFLERSPAKTTKNDKHDNPSSYEIRGLARYDVRVNLLFRLSNDQRKASRFQSLQSVNKRLSDSDDSKSSWAPQPQTSIHNINSPLRRKDQIQELRASIGLLSWRTHLNIL